MGEETNGGEPQGEPTPPADFASLPQATQDYIRGLRTENAKYRTRARDTEAQIKALGDAPQQIRSLKLAVALRDHGAADPELVEFLLRKEGKWDDLDGNDVEVLRDRVDDLLARRPELKSQRRPPVVRSGSPNQTPGPGNPNPSGQLSRSELHGMTPEQVERHFREGNLDQILGRTR
jgi:hypothetical protein